MDFISVGKMVVLENDWYCPLPFRHAYVDSNGIAACCQTARYPVSFQQWPQTRHLQSLQRQLLSGEKPRACKQCHDQEHLHGKSLRTDSLREYGHQRFQHLAIDFVDFRSSNICNFKCRSCTADFSHGIAQEARQHPELIPFVGNTNTKTVSMSEHHADWIIANIGNLNRIMFTGGEPTVIPQVRRILERVMADPPPNLQVLITSNASWSDQFWQELTQRLPRLHWTISLDAVEDRASIIRHGSDWARISDNATWLAQNAQSLDINTVVSNLNVFALAPLLRFVRTLQEASRSPHGRHGDLGCRHQFTVCTRPFHLAADNWPPSMRDKLRHYLERCQGLVLDGEQSSLISGLLNSVNHQQFDNTLWQRTLRYNAILDSVRQENHEILYEEHW